MLKKDGGKDRKGLSIMKGKKILLAGLIVLMMVAGLVLAGCNWGEYKNGDDVLKLSAGHTYEYISGGVVVEKGTYKKSGSTITFTPNDGSGSYEGTKKGKKITFAGGYVMKKSVDGDGTIDVDVEFDDAAAEAEWDGADDAE
jgi:hypothetical protein